MDCCSNCVFVVYDKGNFSISGMIRGIKECVKCGIDSKSVSPIGWCKDHVRTYGMEDMRERIRRIGIPTRKAQECLG